MKDMIKKHFGGFYVSLGATLIAWISLGYCNDPDAEWANDIAPYLWVSQLRVN